jgi:hypothetical protein
MILAVTQLVVAQTAANIKVKRVTASPQNNAEGKQIGWTIAVVFDSNLDLTSSAEVAAAENVSNYRAINIIKSVPIALSNPRIFRRPSLSVSNKVLLTVPLDSAATPSLNDKDLFHLYAFNLTFDKSPPLEPLQSPISVQQAESDSGTSTLPSPKWRLKPSTDRDSSDIYGSYELTKSRGGPTTGNGDLKVAIPFSKDFWNRHSVFSPLVDIKANSDAQADPDSLKFAVEWLLPVKNWDTSFVFPTVALINSGKIEAPKNFNNINALWEQRWLFPSAQIPGKGKRFRMFLDPFVGSELGKNLKSPLKAAEGKGIARLMAGVNLTLQIPVKNLVALKGFEFTSSYIRRWPLKRELLVDKDTNGNLVPLTLSKGPKDYSDSKFIIKVNDYFGPYIGYEWGRLPPNYELVDHKWTLGLLFKSKIK